jgi:hypothetical protein
MTFLFFSHLIQGENDYLRKKKQVSSIFLNCGFFNLKNYLSTHFN